MDLGQWRVFDSVQFPDASTTIFPGAGNVSAVRVDATGLHERIIVLDDSYSVNHRGESDFQMLAALLAKFCDDHNEHELYLINSSGDLPWAVCEQYPWFEWAEIIGPNTDLGMVDLPKNLTEDLHFQSWEEAERHLLRSHRYDPAIFPGDIDLVRQGFRRICQA